MEKVFITRFMIAVSNCSLYSKDHDSFDDLAHKTHDALTAILQEQFEIMVIDGELVVNNKPLRDAGLHRNSLIKRLNRKGISRVDFTQGISLAEVKQLIVEFANNEKGLRSYPHIKAGEVDVMKEDSTADNGSGEFSTPEEIEQIREFFDTASTADKFKLKALHDMVVRFMGTFKKEANILQFMSPVKSYSEHTYIHAMNVSVLTMFQAKYLGFDDVQLYDIGIAALLHDVGKLFISKEVLDKPGKLDDSEYNQMKNHTVYGASYLAKIDSITRLASIVAYEHHLQFDGSGYPGYLEKEKKQHICSQIVTIADFFDALRSRRPYRESWHVNKIFVLMKKNSGTAFNPVLLDHFIAAMESSINQ